jgi:ribulose-5-phosphate 4-epimerase/fuculose-1-phosphate aldolase
MEKPGSRELGLSAIEELKKGRNACLLANHGVVAVGGDLAQSYIRAEYVEDAAKIYHHALQVAEPVIIG